MKAGIIAAKRDNKIGSDGIADQAEIMTLRICTREGEPYLKDMALASLCSQPRSRCDCIA